MRIFWENIHKIYYFGKHATKYGSDAIKYTINTLVINSYATGTKEVLCSLVVFLGCLGYGFLVCFAICCTLVTHWIVERRRVKKAEFKNSSNYRVTPLLYTAMGSEQRRRERAEYELIQAKRQIADFEFKCAQQARAALQKWFIKLLLLWNWFLFVICRLINYKCFLIRNYFVSIVSAKTPKKMDKKLKIKLGSARRFVFVFHWYSE